MKLATLQSPIYDNDRVLSPEGELMFLCRRKKSNWYLSRNLATKISDDPFTIQLDFKPGGSGQNDPYYLQELKNICCACGAEKDLTKHHVIPRCYRSSFPEALKSHSHKDVLLLCRLCHGRYEWRADKLKRELAQQYNVPFQTNWTKEQKNVFHAKRHANSLLNYGDVIPDERRGRLLNQIYSVFDLNVSLEDIAKTKIEYEDAEHGPRLVAQLTDIQAFIQLWRDHFLEHAKPQFLPNHWK